MRVMAGVAKEIHDRSNVPITDTVKPFFANLIEDNTDIFLNDLNFEPK